MDIKSIINEHLPEGVELPEKAITNITKDIKKAVGEEFIPKEWHSKKSLEWEKEKTELEKAVGEANGKASDYESLKKAFDDEKKAHKDYRDTVAAEKEAAEIDGLVADALKKADKEGRTMNAAAIPKALKLYDRKLVERDKDGKPIVDKAVEAIRGEWGEFLGKVEQKGAEVGGKPAGAGTDGGSGDSGKPNSLMNQFIRSKGKGET